MYVHQGNICTVNYTYVNDTTDVWEIYIPDVTIPNPYSEAAAGCSRPYRVGVYDHELE